MYHLIKERKELEKSDFVTFEISFLSNEADEVTGSQVKILLNKTFFEREMTSRTRVKRKPFFKISQALKFLLQLLNLTFEATKRDLELVYELNFMKYKIRVWNARRRK